MFKAKGLLAALLLVGLLGLAGCGTKQANASFLPESYNDELLVILPEDWQFMENWQFSETVPELLLNQGESCLKPAQFGYSWGYYADPKGEEITGFIACGMSPWQAQDDYGDLPRLERGVAETVGLVWQAEPTEIRVTAYAYDLWQQRTCGNTEPEEILHQEITLAEDYSFSLLDDEHSYIYLLDAKWQSETEPGLGGSSQWAFFVE